MEWRAFHLDAHLHNYLGTRGKWRIGGGTRKGVRQALQRQRRRLQHQSLNEEQETRAVVASAAGEGGGLRGHVCVAPAGIRPRNNNAQYTETNQGALSPCRFAALSGVVPDYHLREGT